ncbi:hypothetical protein [Chryseobacterium sp. VD8]|uniref:hypothetical protein n=1 Tax=Chryseobacterium sp. VD8 TaxID=3081254 RepID=UPI003019B58C
MKIELIPVIEVSNYDEDLEMPSGSYLEFPDEWERYNISANVKAGFSESFRAYFKSSFFYRITEISDADLLKIIHREIEIQQTEENRGIDDLACSMSGGYILKINDVDTYFPQCCGRLKHITEWEDLVSDEGNSCFYTGHPSPKVEIQQHKITFDFLHSMPPESYAYPVSEDQIEVDKESLKTAVDNAKKELQYFSQQLIRINKKENLNIPEIDKIFIYGIDD